MEGNSVLFIYPFIYFFMRNEHVFERVLDAICLRGMDQLLKSKK